MSRSFYVSRGIATTYARFGRQVERRAEELVTCAGETVAVWADRSPDFLINLFALWRTGAVPFLVSRRLPWSLVPPLLVDGRAAALLTDDAAAATGCPVPVLAMSGDGEGSAEPVERRPGLDWLGSSRQEIALLLHTSGTTRTPKIVQITRAALHASLRLEQEQWRGSFKAGDASLGWLPLYHSYGLISDLLQGYLTGSTSYFVEPEARALLRQLEEAPIARLCTVPWMLDQLLELPAGAAALARLRGVVVAGAALRDDLVERCASANIRLIQQYGMTEIGAFLRSQPLGGDPRDLTPIVPERFWHLDEASGELVVHRDCPTLANLRHEDFRTGDAFERAHDGALRYLHRLDDVLVHASGEKSNALAIEQRLAARLGRAVERLLVVGTGRLRPACVLSWRHEPSADDREALRRAIAAINDELPAHSRIQPELVLQLGPAERERLPLSAKGTVLRTHAERGLAAELDRLYAGAPEIASRRSSDAATTRAELFRLVRAIVAEARGAGGPETIVPDRGFAEQGIDSLMSVRIQTLLTQALGRPLPATLAFDHPTVEEIVEHLAGTATDAREPDRSEAGAEAIAIVGAACRLPGGANDVDGFWRVLTERRVVATEVPERRWRAADWYDPEPGSPGRSYVKRAGFLDDVETFDAAFFRISPREAQSLDPQQRLLLEVGWEALEDAGCDPTRLAPATGVFVGASTLEHAERIDVADPDAGYAITGNCASMLAGRLSFFLGLHGPSLTVDTACSSALTALHLACQSLRSGECEQALVGAVNLLLSPRSFVGLSMLRALSPSGECRTFSADADGFGRAEGCIVVVLRRVSDALRDGDRILAVIRGTAVNHDGPSSGLTVPNGPAQQAVLRAALARAGVVPAEVDLVECHGSATPLGDPIEVQALAAVYGQGRPPDRPLLLGAVKSNVGHLEAAAGLAGLLKCALALSREEIPAQPALAALNDRIPWSELPVQVVREPVPWRRGERPRLAGISAFGLSGTNAHVIVEEAPVPAPAPTHPGGAQLLLLSARSPDALEAASARLLAHLDSRPELELADVAFGLATGRAEMEHRMAAVARSREELAAALARSPRGKAPSGAPPRVVFVFSGQGSQWVGMGRQLLDAEPVFREALERCDAAIRAEAGWSLLEELAADEERSRLGRVDVGQPALFAMQVALAALWRSWGVEPAAVVGHSVGEIAAAHVAGALSLEDAVAIVCRRGRLLMPLAGRGAMAVVELPAREAEAALRGREDRLSVASCNGPTTTVLSGEPRALEEVLASLDAKGVFVKRVKVDFAGHSPQVDAIRDDFVAALARIEPGPTAVPMRSTVSTAEVRGEELDAGYWAENLRRPVRFAETVQALVATGHDLFLEISPHPILAPQIEEILLGAGSAGAAIGSLRHGGDERASLLQSAGELWTRGLPLRRERVFSGRRGAPLPTYPWQRERHWVDAASPAAAPRARALADGIFDVEWIPRPLPTPLSRPGRWMLLADTTGVGARLAAELARHGQECVRVERDDLERRLAEAAAPGGSPWRGIVCLWPLDETRSDAEPTAASAAVARRCAELVRLVQAVARRPPAGAAKLWLVCRGAVAASADTGPTALAQAPLAGLAQVAALEHPDLWGGLVDLDPAAAADDAASLARELLSASDEDQMAYRSGRRLVARLRRVPPPPPAPARFAADGSYLVTGGLGGIGLRAAEWMVARGARSLILTGRRPPSEGAMPKLRALEAAGASIRVVQADVGDPAAMARLFAEIAASGSPLRGVLHAAGVAVEREIVELGPAELSDGLRAKLLGTLILHEHTRTLDLDFFIGFSSLATVLGARGLAVYAAGNRFLDALIHVRRRQGLPGMTIDWGLWRDGALGTEALRQRLARGGLAGMGGEEALEMLFDLQASGRIQAAVARVDLRLVKELEESRRRRPFLDELVEASDKPPTVTDDWRSLAPGERREAVGSHLREQAARVLGMAARDLDPSRPLTGLGLDSLMAVQLRKRLAVMGIHVELRALLQGASVDTLTDAIAGPAAAAPSLTRAFVSASWEPQGRTNPWILVPRPRPDAALRLVCFPNAGAGPAEFGRWPEGLPETIELGAVHLPGRGSRLDEPPFERMEPLVDALVPGILPYLREKPFAFFGHCLGAVTMFEVMHRLRRDHGLSPIHFFACGARAPQCFTREQRDSDVQQFSQVPGVWTHDQPEPLLLDVLRDLGFDSSRALYEDAELRRLMLPTVRADFKVNTFFDYEPRPRVDVPITAVAGRVDPFATVHQIRGWGAQTTSAFELVVRPGGHYFIETERELIVEVVARRLSRYEIARGVRC